MGGDYYDRDVQDIQSQISSSANNNNSNFFNNSNQQYSDLAKQVFQNNVNLNPGLNPTRWKEDNLKCESKNPIVFCLDITGSMGDWPMIIWDKMPMFYGQIKIQDYLSDPAISFCAIGDATCDEIPLQVSDFGQGKEIDQLISKMVLFRSGGGNDHESYELGAYFYYNYCNLVNPEFPFFFITGDEGYWDSLSSSSITNFIGRNVGNIGTIDSFEVWQLLKEKYNVFIIKKKYGKKEIIQWNKALGEERVLDITHPKAVVDIILGAISITTGARTMDSYVQDMVDRQQNKERIEEVTNSLKKYNEKLLKGEICVVKGSVLQKKLDSKSDDFSKIKEIVDKLILTNISNDKAKLYEDLKKLKITLGDKLPDEIICPITKEIFFDPVSTVDGATFEKEAIQYWFQENDTSPITGLKLASKNLINNFLVKKFVTEFYEKHK